MKLSRRTAIFEFSSPNGYTSFNLNFECRGILIKDLGDENQSHFSYWDLVGGFLPDPRWIESSLDIICEDRGFEWDMNSGFCSTAFQGKKCSMI